jgi:hypothetical protein
MELGGLEPPTSWVRCGVSRDHVACEPTFDDGGGIGHADVRQDVVERDALDLVGRDAAKAGHLVSARADDRADAREVQSAERAMASVTRVGVTASPLAHMQAWRLALASERTSRATEPPSSAHAAFVVTGCAGISRTRPGRATASRPRNST